MPVRLVKTLLTFSWSQVSPYEVPIVELSPTALLTFVLQHGHEVELVAEDGDEVVVGGGDDRREV